MGKRDDLTEEGRRTFDAMTRLGLSEAAAFDATVGRGDRLAVIVDPFDRVVGTFESFGLSPAAAREAAIGRGRDEHEVRETLAEALPSLTGIETAVDELLRAEPALECRVALCRVLAERYVAQGVKSDRATSLAAEAIVHDATGELGRMVKAANRVEESQRPAPSRRAVKPAPVARRTAKAPTRSVTHHELVAEAVRGGMSYGDAEARIAEFARTRGLSIAKAVKALADNGICAGTR